MFENKDRTARCGGRNTLRSRKSNNTLQGFQTYADKLIIKDKSTSSEETWHARNSQEKNWCKNFVEDDPIFNVGNGIAYWSRYVTLPHKIEISASNLALNQTWGLEPAPKTTSLQWKEDRYTISENDHTQYTTINNSKHPSCAATFGVPQDSVLGPFLFLMCNFCAHECH